MKVYIAGPITGQPDLNRIAFGDAVDGLRAAGYEPLSPHLPLVDGWGWNQYMCRALALMLTAQAVALLHGWGDSPGARIEAQLAKDLGMQVADITDYMDGTI